jgi:ribA/ribD-fused uncharacterized protein
LAISAEEQAFNASGESSKQNIISKMKEQNDALAFLSPFHEFLFEDKDHRVYPTVEHYYQSHKFYTTVVSHAEAIRLSKTVEEATKLGHSAEHPIRRDWELVRARVLLEGVALKFRNKSLLNQLLETDQTTIENYFLEHFGENHLLCEVLVDFHSGIKSELEQKAQQPVTYYTPVKKASKVKFAPAKPKNIYRNADGSVLFDMVTSNAVRIESSSGSDITVDMKAIPEKAKTVAHIHQFEKKHWNDIESSDDEYDEIDTELSEYMYSRTSTKKPIIEIQEESYSEQMQTLVALGFTDESANLAALMSSDGDINSALDILSTM